MAEQLPTLLPCPFCDAAMTANTNQADFIVKRYGAHFNHPDNTCYLSGGEVSPAEVEDWNRRPHAPAQSALDELRREVEQVAERNAELMKDLDEACADQQRWQADYERLLGEVEALRADRDRDAEVVKAADLWWRGHRPLGFTREQHIANPAVNADYTGRAHALAIAVGKRAAIDTARTSTDETQPK